MGNRGTGEFASDDALDWIENLDPAEGLGPVMRELGAVVDATDPRLTVARAEIALAAAELVAAAGGQPHPHLPEAARRWLDAVTSASSSPLPIEALIDATRALDYVVTSSQLAEAWSQRNDAAGWRTAQDDLRMRLAAAGGVPPASEP